MQSLLSALALPEFGLSTVFVVSLVSATLLPLGSEPVVFGLIKLNPELFWPAMCVATVGNTAGGAISWWMGHGAHRISDIWRRGKDVAQEGPRQEAIAHQATAQEATAQEVRALRWLHALGPKACLLSWLPGVGDPLCAVAGWLKLSFWPCVFYMAIGKFLRYVLVTSALLWVFPQHWGLGT